ncbi:uncharacterized protein LOC130891913 [Diorhabda carinulata]|uniref:uncharacterized protein LOC130443719 n=1 Tax=Diorhabda sublineata TaxID=1163346 RepID=UPI0024E096BF|nr:uncharacterized protein LOC130443719 [Diorhabda sublineata]XP_057652981.1 uncharacterized protein LOC130891913 [Diorhabda carinulata]
MMFKVIYNLFCVLTLIRALEDPFDFDIETCVKIFYTKENTYNIYCLTYIDNEDSLGIITDHNDTITFKKNPDSTDESKICAVVRSVQGDEKHCLGSIRYNCMTMHENPKTRFVKTPENIPCKEIPLEETQVYCIGFGNNDFTLVFYCEPVIFYLRRTVLYVPDNKPKRI